jgi:hypothetical protein
MTAGEIAPSAPRASTPAAEVRAAFIACGLACMALALSGVFPVNNPDTFGHLAQGRQIAELGHVPSHDTLSIWQPRPAPWHNYEWLSDWIGWQLYAAGGPTALIALKCATLAIAAALITALAWLLAGPRAAVLCALLLIAAIPASRFRFTERPHVVALPLAALYLIGLSYLLRAWGKPSRRADVLWIAALGALHVVWVNLHGSHLLGLVLTIVHIVLGFAQREARARLVAVLVLQLVASCISPYGPAIVLDAVEHTLDPSYRRIVTEWESWNPTDPFWLMGAPVLQTVVLAAVVRALWRHGPVGRALLAFSCVLALAAFRSIRFVAEYLMLSAPAIAVGFQMALRAPWRRFLAGVLPAGALVALAAAWGAPRLPPFAGLGVGASYVGLPAGSGQWLAAHAVSPRVFAAIEDSWYLMFAVPRARFLVDGRIPFYGPEHIQHVRRAFGDEAALSALLERYRVDTVVVRHTFAPQRRLFGHMHGRAGWLLASIEDRYSLFVRAEVALRDGARPRAVELQPGYEPEWLLAADAARAQAIAAALARLPAHENTRGYAGWVRAVLALKPLLRSGRDNGLRPAESDAERVVLQRAQRWLARAAKGAEGVPIVHAYHALVAATRCDLDAAQHAIEQARWEGESRETLLGAQEIALRRGQLEPVHDFLQRAAAMPGAATDPWLKSLRESLRSPPRCDRVP